MPKTNKSIIKHINDFLDYCEVEKGLSPVSTRNYHNFLKVFIEWLNDHDLTNLKPQDLSNDHIWQYRLYLSRKKDDKGHYLKKTTQGYYLIALRNLLNYFATKDIDSLSAEKINLPKITDKDRKIKFLSFEQVEKLLSMVDLSTPGGLRDRAILEVLFSTGMRVSELTSLNIKNFNLPDLLKGSSDDKEIAIYGKGGSARTIYFSPRSIDWLSRYLKIRKDLYPPLFINYKKGSTDNERRLTVRSVENMIKKYASMAALPVDVTPHTLRHSYATDLLNQGADLRSVQELLGHKNIVTTQVYTHVTNPKLKLIHKKFHSGQKK